MFHINSNIIDFEYCRNFKEEVKEMSCLDSVLLIVLNWIMKMEASQEDFLIFIDILTLINLPFVKEAQ